MARSGVRTCTVPKISIPLRAHRLQAPASRSAARYFVDQAPRHQLRIAPAPSKKVTTLGVRRLQGHRRLQGRAGVEPGADAVRQWRALGQAGGLVERAIAADEFRAVAGPAGLAPRRVGEGDAERESRCSSDCAQTWPPSSASISVLTMMGADRCATLPSTHST